MPDQIKTRLGVIEQGKRALQGIKISTAMVRVATCTTIWLLDDAMGIGGVDYLLAGILVAIQA
jgi:hypothetical protein